MFMLSTGGPAVFTTANGLLQMLGPANMRARLLSTYVMVTFGLQPIASVLVGYSAERLGTPAAIGINGLLLVLAAAVILLVRPELRAWEMHLSGAGSAEMVEPGL